MAKSKDTLKTRRERRTDHELHSHRAHSIASIASADNKSPNCIELTATCSALFCKTLLLSVLRFIHFLFHDICWFPVSDRQKIHNAIHGPSHSIDTDNRRGIHTIDNGLCLLSILLIDLLSLHNRLVFLHVQSSSTTTTITQPHSLLPHSKLQTDCNFNTLLGFDPSSKPYPLHLANTAPTLVSVCSPILQHFLSQSSWS